jgi:hypothetical protein
MALRGVIGEAALLKKNLKVPANYTRCAAVIPE